MPLGCRLSRLGDPGTAVRHRSDRDVRAIDARLEHRAKRRD